MCLSSLRLQGLLINGAVVGVYWFFNLFDQILFPKKYARREPEDLLEDLLGWIFVKIRAYTASCKQLRIGKSTQKAFNCWFRIGWAKWRDISL